jgi:hypothetical protein
MRFASAAWSSAGGETPFLHSMESPNLAATLRKDTNIGILYVVAKPQESSTGVVLRPQGSDEIRPHQLISQAPATRVCILQDLPEEHLTRTPSDRYAANIARRFGFQLHNGGVPAVIVIPPLRESLAASVLTILAQTLTRFPIDGERALLAAVQEARVKIAAEANSNAEIATEIAFDLCFYVSRRLNLSKQSGGT